MGLLKAKLLMIRFRRGIFGFKNDTELSRCQYNKDDPVDKLCPIFVLKDIALGCGVTNFSSLSIKVNTCYMMPHIL